MAVNSTYLHKVGLGLIIAGIILGAILVVLMITGSSNVPGSSAHDDSHGGSHGEDHGGSDGEDHDEDHGHALDFELSKVVQGPDKICPLTPGRDKIRFKISVKPNKKVT